MSATPKGLHAKLAEVYAIVERVPKNGTAAPEMGAYKFVQVGDAAEPIRKALSERKLTMLPTAIEIVGQTEHEAENRSGKMVITTTCDLRVSWTITDGESGESIVIQSMGSGQDRGDKYVPKALTNSMKYAILLAFLLPTGDDPEASITDDRRGRRPTQEAAQDAKRAGPEYVSQGIKSYAGKIAKGDGVFNDAQWHQGPSGHQFQFRLEIEGGIAIHEVIVTGPIGEAMYLAQPNANDLLGATVEVYGEAFRIDDPPKKARARLMVERIKGPGFQIPAIVEAPSVAMFDADEQAAIDAALATA